MRYTDCDSISNDSTTVQMSYRSLFSEQVHGPGIDLSRSGKVGGGGGALVRRCVSHMYRPLVMQAGVTVVSTFARYK